MKTKITILLFLFVSLTAYSQRFNYVDGKKEKSHGEEISVQLHHNLVLAEADQEFAESLVTLAPEMLSLVYNIALNKIEKRVKKFAGEHNGQGISRERKLGTLPDIDYKRTVTLKDGEVPLAMSFEFKPVKIAEGLGYYLLNDLQLDFTKAKTTKKNPYVDIHLGIKLKVISEKEGKAEKREVAVSDITIPLVQSGDQLVSLDRASEYISEIIILSPGDFVSEVEISVKETNPHKIKAENIKEWTSANKDSMKSFLDALLKELLPEKEEEDSEEKTE